MYENIVCRYEALVSTKHIFIVVVILQENHVDADKARDENNNLIYTYTIS